MKTTTTEASFLKTSTLIALLTLAFPLTGFIGLITSSPRLLTYIEGAPAMNFETMVGVLLIIFSIFQFNRTALSTVDARENQRDLLKAGIVILIAAALCTLLRPETLSCTNAIVSLCALLSPQIHSA